MDHYILKKIQTKKIILLLLSIITFSCNTNGDDTTNYSDYSEYITESSIDTDIYFMPVETYNTTNTSQTPSLKLKLITTEIFPCINYGLATTEFNNFKK